ncbi:MAG: TonB-dependent receptor [Chryseolinea sp.]
MKQLEIIVFLLCSLCCSIGYGQSTRDSVTVLRTVTLTQSRLSDYAIASYRLPLDSTTLALGNTGSLTDLLRKQGFGHIRSYGPGGLASPSFRGTGSSHTSILWNGINLISPLSGQADLSLIPVGLFEEASIQTGGTTSLSGNGSIGGTIRLNNNLKFNQGFNAKASSQFGSFNSHYHDLSLSVSKQKFATSIKLFRSNADNNFKYKNNNFFPAEMQRRAHSASRQQGFLNQVRWQPNHQNLLSLNLWYQNTRYEIPNPTTVIRTSQATERDAFYRGLLGWTFTKENFDVNYQAAFMRQDLNYDDPEKEIHSLNRYNSVIQNLELNFDLNNSGQFSSGVHYTWEEGMVDAFGKTNPVRNRVAFFGAYKFDPSEQWKVALSAREELVNGKATPFAPTLSLTYSPVAILQFFTNISRNYRLPTFNDLFWKEGGVEGNPALKPELSIGGEAGVKYITDLVNLQVVLFSNKVDNWIIWLPGSGYSYGPENIKKVWSRGAEFQTTLKETIGTVNTRLIGQYSFTASTNESIYQAGNPNEKRKQLILTPRHEGSLTAEGEWKNFVMRIVASYTGRQYNDTDNSPYNIVQPYLITNWWLSKRFLFHQISLTATAEINNVFNVAYVGRPGYPLAGINYKAGIQINYNKPNKL